MNAKALAFGMLGVLWLGSLWLSYGLGAFMEGLLRPSEYAPPPNQRLLSLKWNDVGEPPQFYGAEITGREAPSGQIAVHGRILVGPGNGMWMELDRIGTAEDWNEAITAWGNITWDEEGLAVGPEADPFHLDWDTIRRHR